MKAEHVSAIIAVKLLNELAYFTRNRESPSCCPNKRERATGFFQILRT
jgi:hypothetical protein